MFFLVCSSCKVFKNVFHRFVFLAKSSKTFFGVLYSSQSLQKRFSSFCIPRKVFKNVFHRFVFIAKPQKRFSTFCKPCKVSKNVFRRFANLAKSSKTFFDVLYSLQSLQKRFSSFRKCRRRPPSFFIVCLIHTHVVYLSNMLRSSKCLLWKKRREAPLENNKLRRPTTAFMRIAENRQCSRLLWSVSYGLLVLMLQNCGSFP